MNNNMTIEQAIIIAYEYENFSSLTEALTHAIEVVKSIHPEKINLAGINEYCSKSGSQIKMPTWSCIGGEISALESVVENAEKAIEMYLSLYNEGEGVYLQSIGQGKSASCLKLFSLGGARGLLDATFTKESLATWLIYSNQPEMAQRIWDKAHLIPPKQGEPKRNKAQSQEQLILTEIRRFGIDPLKMPYAGNGKPTIKKQIRTILKRNHSAYFGSDKVFENAWERLRANNCIKWDN